MEGWKIGWVWRRKMNGNGWHELFMEGVFFCLGIYTWFPM